MPVFLPMVLPISHGCALFETSKIGATNTHRARTSTVCMICNPCAKPATSVAMTDIRHGAAT
jgi:hypothetical protein